MRLNWNFLWLAMLTAFALFSAGCSGVNAGGSVSPVMFLLPGVMNTAPVPATGARMFASNPPKPSKALAQQFAQAR